MGTEVPAPYHQARARRVLVIDSYAAGRRTIHQCITELGHESVEIATLENARAVDARTFDLVIANCDVVTSRNQVAALLDQAPELPVVVTSTLPRPQPVPRAIFLDAPLSLDLLDRVIVTIALDPART